MNKSKQKYILLTTVSLVACIAFNSVTAANFEPTWGRDGMVVTSVGPAAAS